MKEYYKTDNGTLYHGDCLEIMTELKQKFDMVLTDPPYGTTACKWDSIIPLEPMWKQLKRLIKPDGAIAIFGIEPFGSILRISNINSYKYDWVWEKNMVTGLMLAKRQPLRKYELISIFYEKQPIFNRQMIKKTEKEFKASYRKNDSINSKSEHYISKKIQQSYKRQQYKPPVNIIKFNIDRKRNGKQHPTQKPVALMEYLIKTYTNENETVLDFTAGSGTTGIACERLKRKWIMIEKEEKYCEIAVKRIKREIAQRKLPGF